MCSPPERVSAASRRPSRASPRRSLEREVDADARDRDEPVAAPHERQSLSRCHAGMPASCSSFLSARRGRFAAVCMRSPPARERNATDCRASNCRGHAAAVASARMPACRRASCTSASPCHSRANVAGVGTWTHDRTAMAADLGAVVVRCACARRRARRRVAAACRRAAPATASAARDDAGTSAADCAPRAATSAASRAQSSASGDDRAAARRVRRARRAARWPRPGAPRRAQAFAG